jgi:hypothetical protein
MKTLTTFRLPLLVAAMGLSLSTAVAQIYPVSYQNYAPGNTADGLGSPTPARSIPGNAVVPQNSDIDAGEANNNFVSLGFGGSIDLVFAVPFGDGEGADLTIYETSYNTPSCSGWPEYADVYVSQDGCNWVLVRSGGCQNFDIELPDNMPWGLYVRIKDSSVAASFSPNADGYDVDGVSANFASSVVPGSPSGPRFATGFQDFVQGKTKNGATITANRSIPTKAVGPTTGSDASQTPIFVSLGFDNLTTAATEARITLVFDYTIFDQAGADLTVFETTFGDRTTRSCNDYPEIALFEGSNDGATWYTLAADPSSGEPVTLLPGQLCRDGKLDIGNMPAGSGGEKTLRYLRITDNSTKASSRFPGAADGYDVDGVFGYGCQTPGTGGGKFEFYDQNNVPDEDASAFTVGLFPNPTANVLNINLETAAVDQNYVIRITDMTGRLVIADALNAASNSSINHVIDVQALPAGVYMVSVEANGYKALNKLMKN